MHSMIEVILYVRMVDGVEFGGEDTSCLNVIFMSHGREFSGWFGLNEGFAFIV